MKLQRRRFSNTFSWTSIQQLSAIFTSKIIYPLNCSLHKSPSLRHQLQHSAPFSLPLPISTWLVGAYLLHPQPFGLSTLDNSLIGNGNHTEIHIFTSSLHANSHQLNHSLYFTLRLHWIPWDKYQSQLKNLLMLNCLSTDQAVSRALPLKPYTES